MKIQYFIHDELDEVIRSEIDERYYPVNDADREFMYAQFAKWLVTKFDEERNE